MMGRRQKLNSGDEWDIIYRKHWYGCVHKIKKYVKRKLNKRYRKELKMLLRREQEI